MLATMKGERTDIDQGYGIYKRLKPEKELNVSIFVWAIRVIDLVTNKFDLSSLNSLELLIFAKLNLVAMEIQLLIIKNS